MTVGDLLSLLVEGEYPEDAEIIIAKDAEGNRYSPLVAIEAGLYCRHTADRGDFSTHNSDTNEPWFEEDRNAVCFKPAY